MTREAFLIESSSIKKWNWTLGFRRRRDWINWKITESKSSLLSVIYFTLGRDKVAVERDIRRLEIVHKKIEALLPKINNIIFKINKKESIV